MLLKFTVGNYKVFKEKNILDLRATSLSELSDHNTLQVGTNTLLKSAIIYGKNASGKSKLLNALEFMADFVIESAKDRQITDSIETDPFRLNQDNLKKASHFEVEFLLNETHYRYGFEVTQERVVKEWLLERPKTKEYPLFLRIEDEFQIDTKRFPEGKAKESWTRKNALFLSLVAQLNGQLSQEIIEWFSKLVFAHHFCDCEWHDDNVTERLLNTNGNSKYKKAILELLQKADIDINDIELIEFNEARSSKTGKSIQTPYGESLIYTYHKKYGVDNKALEEVPFNLYEDESAGTIRFFNLIGIILEALENGEVVLLDEIDGRLHTLLSKAIVLLFNSEKNRKAQFIFTTHDTNLLNKDLFRRDQIYFIEKDRYGAANTYALSDFKINDQKVRKDADYESNYLKGKYGAIPFINNF
ncbi:MAG: ATP-binding protein [Bacteroidota bacterium]